MKVGRKREYPEKAADDELQKILHTKARRFKPQARIEPVQQHWWQARKSHVPLHHASFWSMYVLYGSMLWVMYARSAGLRAVHLVWQRLYRWTLHANFSNKYFHAFHAYMYHRLLYHFAIRIQLSLTLNLGGDHKVSAKQNLLASFPCTLFNTLEWNLKLKSNILIQFLNEI